MPQTEPDRPTAASPTSALPLAVLFGTFYLVQGFNDSHEGLFIQPTQSLLERWGATTSDLGTFMAGISLPWVWKPVYGLLSDFLPIFGRHRKSYLLLTTSVTTLSAGLLGLMPLAPESKSLVFWLLFSLSMSTAFSDVVIDALMVQTCQPLGLTGRMQSVQWSAVYAAGIVVGSLGAWLTTNDLHQRSYQICALGAAFSLALTIAIAREPRQPREHASFRHTVHHLVSAFRTRTILVLGAYLFLWHFNPFTNTVLRVHLVHGLDLSESVYGEVKSIQAIGAACGTVAYGFYCRCFSRTALFHASIAVSIVSNLCYLLLVDRATALVASALYGVAYGSATLMVLDVAAQLCPARAAGTIFAGLMSVANLGMTAAELAGVKWYAALQSPLGASDAYRCMVLVGAVFTAGCWLVVPFARRELITR